MGTIDFGPEDVATYYKSLQDDTYGYKFALPRTLQRPPAPKIRYDTAFPSLRVFTNMLKKKKAKSAGAFNGNRYLVYKRCPGITQLLYGLFVELNSDLTKACRTADLGAVLRAYPIEWGCLRDTFIAKKPGSCTDVSKARCISIGETECRAFDFCKDRAFGRYLIANKYLSTNTSKAFLARSQWPS